MKLSNFEPMRFTEEINTWNLPIIPITDDDIVAIAKKFPPSIKRSFSAYQGKVTFYSKRISMGHNEIEVTRKGNFLIGLKSYHSNNNTDKIIAAIINQ